MKRIFVAIILMLVFVAFTLMLFTGCRATKESTSVTVDSTSIVQTVKPDTNKTAPDSTKLHVELGCDSLNRVIIKMLNDKKSEGVSTNFNFDNGVIDYTTKRPEKVFISYPIQKTINRWHSYAKDNTVYVNYMTLFQKIFFWIGLGGCVVLLVFLGIKIKGRIL